MIILIILAIILSCIAFYTASWRILHNFFFSLIKSSISLVLGIIFMYICWIVLWKSADKDSDPHLTKYLIDKEYYGKPDSIARKAFDEP